MENSSVNLISNEYSNNIEEVLMEICEVCFTQISYHSKLNLNSYANLMSSSIDNLHLSDLIKNDLLNRFQRLLSEEITFSKFFHYEEHDLNSLSLINYQEISGQQTQSFHSNLPDCLIKSAYIKTLIHYKKELEDFQNFAKEILKKVYKLCNGELVYFDVFVVFAGIIIEKPISLENEISLLPFEQDFRAIFSHRATPASSGYGEAPIGMIYLTQEPLKIYEITKTIPKEDKSLFENFSSQFEQLINQIPLAVTLASKSNNAESISYKADYRLKPIGLTGHGSNDNNFGVHLNRTATKEEVGNIKNFIKIFQNTNNQKISIAESKLISSLTSRSSNIDRLIDAIKV